MTQLWTNDGVTPRLTVTSKEVSNFLFLSKAPANRSEQTWKSILKIRGTYHSHRNSGNSGWKFKWYAPFCSEIFRKLWTTGRDNTHFSLFLAFAAVLSLLRNFFFSHKVRLNHLIFSHKVFNRIVCVNGNHPRSSHQRPQAKFKGWCESHYARSHSTTLKGNAQPLLKPCWEA